MSRWRDCKTDPPPTREVFPGEQLSCPVLVLHLGGGMHVERYRKNEEYDVEGYVTCDLDQRDTTGTAVFWRPLPMPHPELQERHAEWMES